MLHLLLQPAIDALKQMEAACAEAEIAASAQREAAKNLREMIERMVNQPNDPRYKK